MNKYVLLTPILFLSFNQNQIQISLSLALSHLSNSHYLKINKKKDDIIIFIIVIVKILLKLIRSKIRIRIRIVQNRNIDSTITWLNNRSHSKIREMRLQNERNCIQGDLGNRIIKSSLSSSSRFIHGRVKRKNKEQNRIESNRNKGKKTFTRFW